MMKPLLLDVLVLLLVIGGIVPIWADSVPSSDLLKGIGLDAISGNTKERENSLEQKDDDTIQVYKALGLDHSALTPEECKQYCHADCDKYHQVLNLDEDILSGLRKSSRCMLANRNCSCGPKPDDFNPTECYQFCHKNCNNFKMSVLSVPRDILKFSEAAYEANRKVKKCEEWKPRCNCGPDANQDVSSDSKNLNPKIHNNKFPMYGDDDSWLQNTSGTMFSSRRHSRNSFFPAAIIICMIVSIVGAVIVTVIACRRQFRFRSESYYQRNLGAINAGPPNGTGFISVQLSGQAHPRVWSYDTSDGTSFISTLQGSQYPQHFGNQFSQPMPYFQPTATATAPELPPYDPPPPYQEK